MIVAGVALFIAFAATSPVFGSLANAENILRQMAPVLLLGLGMMIVVLIGGIDLSVGSVVLAASIAAEVALISGVSGPSAMIIAVLVGTAAGALNALLIQVLRISPLIVSL